MSRPVRHLAGLVAAIALALASDPLPAQIGPGPVQDVGADSARVDPIESDPLTVHLVTAGPGAAVWERFGHNAIWIHDARTGEDVAWEWGVFSFRQEGFYPRLAKGTMLYSMGADALDDFLTRYRYYGRDVWAQELAMTPDQEFALLAAILENAQPGNRDYVYDYYTDNCSTRIRDHLDAALGGAIGRATRGDMTGNTWRDHTLRLLRPDPYAWAGVQFVLGRPGDVEIDRWEEGFLPLKLRDAIRGVTVDDGAGGMRPLVVSERQLVRGGAFTVTESAPRWWPIALGIALVLGGLAWAAVRVVPRAGGVFLLGWGGVIGFLGTLLFVAVLFTDHDHWRWNENLLFASPLTFGWVGVGWILLRGRPISDRAGRVVGGLAALAGAGLVLALLPGGQQTLSTALVLGSVPLGAWFALRGRRDPVGGA